MLKPSYLLPLLPPDVQLETVPVLKALNRASRALADLKGQGDSLNASAALARDIGETVKRIDGTEVPILAKWLRNPPAAADDRTGVDTAPEREPRPAAGQPADATGITEQEAQAGSAARPVSDRNPAGILAVEAAEQKDDATGQ